MWLTVTILTTLACVWTLGSADPKRADTRGSVDFNKFVLAQPPLKALSTTPTSSARLTNGRRTVQRAWPWRLVRALRHLNRQVNPTTDTLTSTSPDLSIFSQNLPKEIALRKGIKYNPGQSLGHMLPFIVSMWRRRQARKRQQISDLQRQQFRLRLLRGVSPDTSNPRANNIAGGVPRSDLKSFISRMRENMARLNLNQMNRGLAQQDTTLEQNYLAGRSGKNGKTFQGKYNSFQRGKMRLGHNGRRILGIRSRRL